MESLLDDALMQIFLRIDDPKTFGACALTCRRWADILASSSPFWVTKWKLDKRLIPTALLTSRFPDLIGKIDYRLIWRKNPYGRNLIRNDSGQEGFKHWHLSNERWTRSQRISGANCGEMFPIEKPPGVGGEMECCFATSHFLCEKRQTIDLWAEGVQPWILDEMKPAIVVSEWHAARKDCGSTYNILVTLQDSNRTPCESFQDSRTVAYGQGGTWEQSLHRFVNYMPGVRYVVFTSSGRSKSIWSGFFGAKMAKASVTVEFN